MKRFPARQEHLLSSAASGLRLPLPACFPAATPRKRGRIPGDRPALGACPAGLSPPGCASPHAGKVDRSPDRARLALEELSQSLSLKVWTGYQEAISSSQEHLLASAASGLRPPLPTCFLAAAPQKRRLSGSPARPRACPAEQSPPGCASLHAGKPRRSPQPGAPGFAGTLAILKPERADWISWSALQ